MLIAVIVACEIAFWVFIAAGLAARYLLKKRALGAALLAASPVVDAVLLVVTAFDLYRGGNATFAHGLAAIYLGISLVYGRDMIAWADVRFAHRFADGPAPRRLVGREYTKKSWIDAGKTLVAMAFSAAILVGLAWLAGFDAVRVQGLLDTARIVGIIAAADALWAVSYTVWPRHA